MIHNVIGCPAGIIPVTKETKEDQARLKDYPVREDLVYRVAKSAALGAEGCPIGVQVAGRHFQEEMVLHAMGIIEELVRAAESSSNEKY